MGKLFESLMQAKISEAVKNLTYKVSFPLIGKLPLPYVEQFADEFVDEKGDKYGVTGFILHKSGNAVEFKSVENKYDSTSVGALTGAFSKFVVDTAKLRIKQAQSQSWTAFSKEFDKVRLDHPEIKAEARELGVDRSLVARFILEGEDYSNNKPFVEFLAKWFGFKPKGGFDANEDFYQDVLDLDWPTFELVEMYDVVVLHEPTFESTSISESVKNVKIKLDIDDCGIRELIDGKYPMNEIKRIFIQGLSDAKIEVTDVTFSGSTAIVSTDQTEAPTAEQLGSMQASLNDGVPDVLKDLFEDEILPSVLRNMKKVGVKASKSVIVSFLIGGGHNFSDSDFEKLEAAGYDPEATTWKENRKFWDNMEVDSTGYAVLCALSR